MAARGQELREALVAETAEVKVVGPDVEVGHVVNARLRTEDERVLTQPARHDIVAGAAIDAIVPNCALQPVGRRTAVERVVAVVTDQYISVVASPSHVLTRTQNHPVLA